MIGFTAIEIKLPGGDPAPDPSREGHGDPVDTYFRAGRKMAFHRVSTRARPVRQGVELPHHALSSSTVPAKRLRSHGPIP